MKNYIKNFSIVLCVFGSANFAKAEQTGPLITCESQEGILLCRDMSDIKFAMNRYCTGNACYQMWQMQINSLKSFTNDYKRSVPFGSTFSPEAGNLAYEAAKLICSSKATGGANDCPWMEALFYAKDGALRYLIETQKAAGLTAIASCSLNYECY